MAWKKVERRILNWCGTQRLGAQGDHGPDGLTSTLSIEVKDRKRLPQWFIAAYHHNGHDNAIPVTVLETDEQTLVLAELDYLLTLLDKAGLATPEKEDLPTGEKVVVHQAAHPKLPKWMANGLKQAITGAEDHRLPIVVLHQKGKHSYHALMPIEPFAFVVALGGLTCPTMITKACP